MRHEDLTTLLRQLVAREGVAAVAGALEQVKIELLMKVASAVIQEQEPSNDESVRLLSVDEVADILRVKRSFVAAKTRSGEIESTRIGKYVRIRPEAVQNYLRFLTFALAHEGAHQWFTACAPGVEAELAADHYAALLVNAGMPGAILANPLAAIVDEVYSLGLMRENVETHPSRVERVTAIQGLEVEDEVSLYRSFISKNSAPALR